MPTDLSFHFVCPVDDGPDSIAQPSFMGFTSGVVSLPERIYACLRCPPHLDALAHSCETVAKFKLAGALEHRVMPLNIGLLSDLKIRPEIPLFLILTTRNQDDQVSKFLESAPFPILHLLSHDVTRINSEDEFAETRLREHVHRIATFLAPQHAKIARKLWAGLTRQRETERKCPTSVTKRYHGVTLPNEVLLELVGYQFAPHIPLCSTKEDDYVKAITESANLLAHERERLEKAMPTKMSFKGPTIDLVLACPGLLQPWWSASRIRKRPKQNEAPDAFDSCSGDEMKQALAFCIRQEGYSIKTSSQEIGKLMKLSVFQFLMEQISAETRMFVACLALQAANDICPVIRLPRRANRARGLLGQLGDIVRREDHRCRSKAHRMARRVVDEINQSFPDDFTPFLNRSDTNVRIVSDMPIEWIRLQGIPLALRHFTSRILPTPGNLLSIQSVKTERCFVNLDRVTKVPVIRAFQKNDRLRTILEECFRTYVEVDGWKLQFEIIDVANESEFVDALNSIDSPFVVFDGHGAHPKDTQVGGIVVGGQELDVWALRGRVRVPPIVLLSACDTSSADRSHASAGNGFLALGAVTVLGTMLPVHGVKSGLMMARLFYRLTSISATWIRVRRAPLSWSRIVGTQIRASFVSELLSQLVTDKIINEDACLSANIVITNAINRFASNWFSVLRKEVLKRTGWSEEDLDRYLNNDFYLPDALKYVKLGTPEKVLFITDEFAGNFSPAVV